MTYEVLLKDVVEEIIDLDGMLFVLPDSDDTRVLLSVLVNAASGGVTVEALPMTTRGAMGESDVVGRVEISQEQLAAIPEFHEWVPELLDMVQGSVNSGGKVVRA